MRVQKKDGILRVTQLAGNPQKPEVYIRDFDASECSHEWSKRGGVDILRVMHDNASDEIDSFEFVEFSTPAHVESIPQD